MLQVQSHMSNLSLVLWHIVSLYGCSTCYPIELAHARMQAFKDTGKELPGVF
ncbi:hypothetical protein SOVF_190770 [Spinacia oleracea]|nr:hypothetical protein SOVF_190770 [Spinacia oleracea]